jgi:hypothetical protein
MPTPGSKSVEVFDGLHLRLCPSLHRECDLVPQSTCASLGAFFKCSSAFYPQSYLRSIVLRS